MQPKGLSWKYTLLMLALIPCVGLFLVCGLVAFAVGNVYITNNKILSEYEQSFDEAFHPIDTLVIVSKSLILPPPGNGSHCYYFVGEIRRYSGTQSEIRSFYANKKFILDFFEEESLQKFPYRYRRLSQLSDWGVSKTNFDENYYLVYMLNSKFNDYVKLDFRCQ